MWHELKEEISRKYKNGLPAYALDFLNRNDEISCTEESCLVNWYNTNFNVTDDDSIEDVDFTSMDNSTEIHLPNLVKTHKNFNPIILHNLGIFEIENLADKNIEKGKSVESTFYTFSKKYLEFVRCINLSNDKKSIDIFNIEIFEKIFVGKYLDKTINHFIDKLVCDPLNYSGVDRQLVIIILLYVYLYMADLKLPKKNLIYEKLKNNIVLIKPDTKFKTSYTRDYNLDKYLLNVKVFEDLYDESNFLNFYYQNYISKTNVEKELLANFIARFNKNILNIDKSLILDFIRRVFLLHTVLYNAVEDIHIYKTVVNFFNKKIVKFDTEQIKKSLLTLYWNIAHKIGQKEIYNLFVIHVVDNLDKFKKLDNLIFKFHLAQIRTWGQYLYIIEENKESYNNLSLAVDLLYFITENVKIDDLKILKEVIDFYLNIYDIIKLDHLIKFIKPYFRHLRNIFINILSLLNNLDHQIEILEFYNLQVDKLSKVILLLQRYVILSIEESKKDKKKESRGGSGPEALFNSFVSVIYKLEDQLITIYGDRVKTTKKRSFKISEAKEI